MTVAKLNTLSDRDAVTFFRQCCGSLAWARAMEKRRPFEGISDLGEAAAEVWRALSEEEWKEAFAHHPRIGDIKELRKRFPSTAKLSEREQAGMGHSDEKTLKALAEGNSLYEAKFGYIFIVCATGKSAGEMLSLLRGRLSNVPHDEITIAAGEQEKITRLRLEALLR